MGIKIDNEGLSPGKCLWPPWSVFPKASASGCAKKFDISSSWFETGSPVTWIGFKLRLNPMKSDEVVSEP